MSLREISRVTGVPFKSVQNIIKSGSARRSQKGRTGRPPKLSPRDVRRLIFEAGRSWDTRRMSLTALAADVEIEASRNTIKKALASVGYHRCVACRRPFINKKQQKQRLQWAKDHIKWNGEVWYRVIWTDECIFESGRRGRIWITRRAGERWHDDCVQSIYRSGRSSFMVWGAIGWNYKSPLVFLERTEGAKGINSKVYTEQVLIPIITPLLDPNSDLHKVLDLERPLILMEDGAKVHEGYARLYRLQQLWECLRPWPPSSPDLNPIEKVWRWIKWRITNMRPFPLTQHALKQAVQRCWDEMDPMKFMKPVENYKDILQEVINKKGLATKY